MRVTVLESLHEVSAAEWNALAGTHNPFVRHEFLSGLETHGCVGDVTGWRPQHLTLREENTGKLVAAAPLYLKDHSYGEFVFDWAWAEAYQRNGLAYYPKLVAAVPFTPATGPRLLIAAGPDHDAIAGQLIDAATDFARARGASSLHWLFTDDSSKRALAARGLSCRSGCQFHWENPGYRDFDDFLSTFTADKRKKIKRERRYVREAGIEVELLVGRSISAADWDLFYSFYRATARTHGAIPYLTRYFFHALSDALPKATALARARRDGETIATALFLRGADTLYGRYWGGHPGIHSLHFETCYYAAIEHCIARGLKRFEAGAQGEHKLARGFVPVPTWSAHWLDHPQFHAAVADFVAREQHRMASYVDELNEHLPYRQSTSDGAV